MVQFAFALCAILTPCATSAAEAPLAFPLERSAGPPRATTSFDIRKLGEVPFSTAVAEHLRFDPFTDEDAAFRRQKIRIRWIYKPLDGGPQFEIGTYGSRKGVMKRKLLHVAVDWSF